MMEPDSPFANNHPELGADVTLDFASLQRDMELIDNLTYRAELVRDIVRLGTPPDMYNQVPRLPFMNSIQSIGYIAHLGKNHVLRHYATYLELKAERIRDIYCGDTLQE